MNDMSRTVIRAQVKSAIVTVGAFVLGWCAVKAFIAWSSS